MNTETGIIALNLTPDDEGTEGTDGLTDAERHELAERARARRLSREGRLAFQAMRDAAAKVTPECLDCGRTDGGCDRTRD